MNANRRRAINQLVGTDLVHIQIDAQKAYEMTRGIPGKRKEKPVKK